MTVEHEPDRRTRELRTAGTHPLVARLGRVGGADLGRGLRTGMKQEELVGAHPLVARLGRVGGADLIGGNS